MLASKTAAVPARSVQVRDAGSWRPILAAAGLSLFAIAWLYWRNPRLLASWHGFLHTAIATRFSHTAFPPEDPFFAGERLPYYWFYHFAAYWFSRALHIDLLHTFHAISWMSLAAFVLVAGWIGRSYFRSNIAGLAIAWLGLVGVNPLGPAIAAAKHYTRGVPLVRQWPGAVETNFVSNQTSDDLMAQPLLGAMYIGGDWRPGQDLVWFFDIGARAPSLAGLLLLLWLMLKQASGWRHYAAIAAVSAFVTAFNPLVGLAAAAALAGAGVLVRRPHNWIAIHAACVAGAAAALPTYWHIFFRSGGSKATLHQVLALPPAVAIANFLVLFPLAVIGARKDGRRTAILVIAGAALLLLAIAVRLPEGNEHNLSNTAQCLLAVPAAAAVGNRRALRLLVLAFLPVTACTLWCFSARPAMPISTRGELLVRTPESGSVEQLYDWMRRETPRESILIVDPNSTLKMSGNVCELPAFTARTLFTDTPSYLTTPNRDAAFRAELASRAVIGEPLTADQSAYLARFGRPVYILTYRPEPVSRLAALYGPPPFHNDFAAAFQIAGARHGR